jgi:hypothetical protein
MPRPVKLAVSILAVLLVVASAGDALAHGHGYPWRTYGRHRSHLAFPRHRSEYGLRLWRNGRLQRNRAAKGEFMRENPCPSTGATWGRCPGYVVDHVIALKRGGLDDPSNMQWQTVEEAKAKDRIE